MANPFPIGGTYNSVVRTRLASIFVVIALITNLSNPAYAEVTKANVEALTSCEEAPESNCISSISATSPDGKVIAGIPTGKHQHINFQAGSFWNVSGDVPVYEFEGLKFSGIEGIKSSGTNQAVLKAFYWPDNSEYCAYGSCTMHNELVIAYLYPYSKGLEYVLFDTQIVFHVVLQLGNDFPPTSSMGRAKNVKISNIGKVTTPSGSSRSVIAFDFTPIRLEQVDFASQDPASIYKASYFEDIPALWIYGQKNYSITKLGDCGKSGGIDVYSNAVSMGLPFWNSKTQTIDIWTKSPHLTTNGSINVGYIEARIPIEMGRCLWGVNLKGEIQGKIAITYEDGSPSSIVTMTGNENSGDYLLIIAGFHFSSPTFHVKLDESMATEKVVEAKPSPSTQPSVDSSSKVLKNAPRKIVCKKGKIKQSFSSTKCPIGYKAA